jgi:hypothetical protein
MELEYFSEQTLPKTIGGRASVNRISFNRQGLISFNRFACDMIGIKTGTKITLAQDKKDTNCWYVFIDPNGFEVRSGYKDKGCMFNHKELVAKVIESVGLDTSKTHSFKIASVPTEIKGSKTKYWGILIPS